MATYHISYGNQFQVKTQTLKAAREAAKRISREVLGEIDIISHGDIVETLRPKISKSGRIAFHRRKHG